MADTKYYTLNASQTMQLEFHKEFLDLFPGGGDDGKLTQFAFRCTSGASVLCRFTLGGNPLIDDTKGRLRSEGPIASESSLGTSWQWTKPNGREVTALTSYTLENTQQTGSVETRVRVAGTGSIGYTEKTPAVPTGENVYKFKAEFPDEFPPDKVRGWDIKCLGDSDHILARPNWSGPAYMISNGGFWWLNAMGLTPADDENRWVWTKYDGRDITASDSFTLRNTSAGQSVQAEITVL